MNFALIAFSTLGLFSITAAHVGTRDAGNPSTFQDPAINVHRPLHSADTDPLLRGFANGAASAGSNLAMRAQRPETLLAARQPTDTHYG